MKSLETITLKAHRQKGEIALMLALLGVVVSLAGIGLGSVAVNQAQRSRSASAQNLYTYKSALELREPDGDVIKTDKKLTWHTTLLATSQYPAKETSGQIQNSQTDRARLEWDATGGAGVPADLQNREARIVLHIPEKWVVRDSYCTDHNNKGGCDGFQADITRTASYDYTITGITIRQGANIEYGLIVEKASAPTPPEPPAPDPNLICKAVGNACQDTYRVTCKTISGQDGTKLCHKVGTCTGVGDGTQCSWGPGSDCETCSASGGGGGNGGGGGGGAPVPPVPGPSCGKVCTYSQAEASGTKCYEGNCKDGSQNCALNTNCGYVPGCSTGKPIRCPGHSPETPSGFPAPSPLPSPSLIPSNLPQNPDSAPVSIYITFNCVGGTRDSFDNDRPKLEEYLKSHTLPKVDLQSTYNGEIIQTRYDMQFSLHQNPYYAYIDTTFDLRKLKNGGTLMLWMPQPPDGFKFCGTPVHGLTKDTPFLNSETRIFAITPESEADAKPTPEPRPARPQSPQINRKILLLTYDVPLLSEEGISTFSYYQSQSRLPLEVNEIVNRTVDTLNTASGLNYRVVKKINITNINDFTTVSDVKSFEEQWKKCFLDDRTVCEKIKDEYPYSYKKLNEKKHVCDMVNKGEIDEVWHAALPGLAMGEDDMFGPLPFGINGLAEVVEECNRDVPTLGIDLSRDAEEAVHSYLHRVERTIAMVYGTELDDSNGGTPWNDFVAYPNIADKEFYDKPRLSEPYGCGSVHIPPNAKFQYDYRSTNVVKTNCQEFFNYPNRRKENIYEIGNFKTSMGFYRWFMVNIPRFPDRDQYGKLNNWWEYIAYPKRAIQDSPRVISKISDKNANNKIDILDISSMYEFLGDKSSEESSLLPWDINQDGVVNGYDLSEVMSHYGEEVSVEKPVHGSYWE